MKTLRNKLLIYLGALILLISCIIGLAGLNLKSVRAENLSTNTELFFPNTTLEYTQLDSPKDFCFFDGNLAVIEGEDVVIHFKDGSKRVISDSGLTALKQIKTFKGNLLVSSNGPLYVISLTDYSVIPLYYQLEDTDYPVSGNYFDLNDDHLVTVFGKEIHCYDVSGDVVTRVFRKTDADGDEPVAINQNGEIFYVSGDTEQTLVKRKVDNFDRRDDLMVFTTNPSFIIANQEKVYFLSAGVVNTISVNGGSVSTIPFSEEYKDYDLGYVSATTEISGVSFNSDKLLISLASFNSIQEFIPIDGTLYFTGYAIANGKTAYNRIGSSASDIDQYHDKIAVLDSYKLTVIKNAENKSYDKNNYFNYTLGEKTFNRTAIGNDTVLLSDVYAKKILILDFEQKTTLFEYTFEGGNHLLDVQYQNGFYYVTELKTGTGNDVNVYAINEKTPSVSSPILTATSEFDVNSIIAVDIYKNVYLTSKDGTKIFKFSKTNEGYGEQTLILSSVTPVKKLATDLNGRLFGITQNNVLYYSNDVEYEVDLSLTKIKSFALSYDKKSVYFIVDNDERIYKCDSLPNASADKFEVPENFGNKQESANVDEFKIYSIKDNANLFLVDYSDGTYFDYLGVYQNHNNEYAFISTISYKINDLPTTEYSLLLGYDNQNVSVFVIVLNSDLYEKTDGIKDVEVDSVYVATDVHLYYLPMITETDDYCLELNGLPIRLEKGTEVKVIKELTFLNKTFYFASLTIEGKEIYGYLPKDFTTFTLYSNPTLNDVDKTIENQNDHTLRNALVTAIVATSVFITSIYFILRKKQG